MPRQPWLLLAAGALLAAGGALIGSEARPTAAIALVILGAVCLGAWIRGGGD